MDRVDADSFAQDWVEAWNDHDLDAILSFYSDGVEFHSPRIPIVVDGAKSPLKGKPALRAYWTAALEGTPGLYFELEHVLIGAGTVTLVYTNHRDQTAAETFIFDEDGEISVAIATYG